MWGRAFGAYNMEITTKQPITYVSYFLLFFCTLAIRGCKISTILNARQTAAKQYPRDVNRAIFVDIHIR